MKLEKLPIWPRIRAAKPRKCQAKTPAGILSVVRANGGLHQDGPVTKVQGHLAWDHPDRQIRGTQLADERAERVPSQPVHGGGTVQYFVRRTVHGDIPFTIRTRAAWRAAQVKAMAPGADQRRAAADPKFRRALKRRQAAQARRREVIMHIADRAAFAAGVRGRLNWGGAVAFSFSGSYKNQSYNPTHAQPGVRVTDDVIYLERTGNGKTITIGPVPGRNLLANIDLAEPHPIGLCAVPVKDQSGVYACMAIDAGKWVVAGYSVAGHAVPDCVATGRITLAEIEAQTNTETRRIMIERYGYGRWLAESGASKIQSDDFGALYQLPDGAKLAHLLNSTPEPDGSQREYFLPVAADCETAHAAVAWSFGCSTAEYRPVEQS